MSGNREEKEPRTEPWGTLVLQSQGDLEDPVKETERKPRKEENQKSVMSWGPNAAGSAETRLGAPQPEGRGGGWGGGNTLTKAPR